MDISNNKKAKTVILISVILVIAVLIAVVFAITSKKINNSTSQGISNPSGDSQTDVKVLHLGDEEPKDVNETFVYQVTDEEEERIRQEAEEYKRQKGEELAQQQIQPSNEEIEKRQENMKTVDDAYQQLIQEGRDMLVRYNGEDLVKQYEDNQKISIEEGNYDKLIGISEGTAKLWELYLNTIWEHDDEITDSERAIVLLTINPNGLEYYAKEHEEFYQVCDLYNSLREKHRDFQDVVAKRLSGE